MLVVEGGVVEVPGRVDLGWNFGLPVGAAFACMCEPMLLALEGRHATTAGVDTPVAVMYDLAQWALSTGSGWRGSRASGGWCWRRTGRGFARSATRPGVPPRAAPAGPGG